MKKLCIIHTTPTTVLSLKPLAAEILPNAACYNLLDDSILPEINSAGFITDSVKNRVMNMFRSAIELSPAAILIACSTIGELVTLPSELTDIPVKRIDEPMCRSAVVSGRRIGVAATLNSTLEPTCRLLESIAGEHGSSIQIKRELVDGINQLLAEGRENEYDEILSERLQKLKADCDAVVLAQASMSRVLARMPGCTNEFLTSPRSGLEALQCIF